MSQGVSHNSRVLRLHLLEDAAGWVIVLIGGIVMHFTGWYFIDPMLAVLLSAFIGLKVLKSLSQVVKIFAKNARILRQKYLCHDYWGSAE